MVQLDFKISFQTVLQAVRPAGQTQQKVQPQQLAGSQQTVVRLQTPQKPGVKQPTILPQGSQIRPGTTVIIGWV